MKQGGVGPNDVVLPITMEPGGVRDEQNRSLVPAVDVREIDILIARALGYESNA